MQLPVSDRHQVHDVQLVLDAKDADATPFIEWVSRNPDLKVAVVDTSQRVLAASRSFASEFGPAGEFLDPVLHPVLANPARQGWVLGVMRGYPVIVVAVGSSRLVYAVEGYLSGTMDLGSALLDVAEQSAGAPVRPQDPLGYALAMARVRSAGLARTLGRAMSRDEDNNTQCALGQQLALGVEACTAVGLPIVARCGPDHREQVVPLAFSQRLFTFAQIAAFFDGPTRGVAERGWFTMQSGKVNQQQDLIVDYHEGTVPCQLVVSASGLMCRMFLDQPTVTDG